MQSCLKEHYRLRSVRNQHAADFSFPPGYAAKHGGIFRPAGISFQPIHPGGSPCPRAQTARTMRVLTVLVAEDDAVVPQRGHGDAGCTTATEYWKRMTRFRRVGNIRQI